MQATKTIKAEIFKGFHSESKIWIYASDRLLSDDESDTINLQLFEFTKQWTAHDMALKGDGKVFYNRFIVMAVDETQTNASGCSIDKSVNFIKTLEIQYGLNLFDRLTIFYDVDGKMRSFHFNDLINKVGSGEISGNTKIYDTTLTQLGAFQNHFIKEARESWLAKFIIKS